MNWTSIFSVTNQVFFVAFIIIVMGIIAGLIFFAYTMLQYKHKFRIRELTNNRKIISDDKAREIKDKHGIISWRLMKARELIPVPPPAAVEVDRKGRKVVEAYRTEDGEYVYAEDMGSVAQPPQNLQDIEDVTERRTQIRKWQKNNNIIAAFAPYTRKQRQIMINQHEKAVEKKGTNIWGFLRENASLFVVAIVIVLLIFNWQGVAQPVIDVGNQVISVQKMEVEKMQILKEIKQDIQIIKSEAGLAAPEVAPN